MHSAHPGPEDRDEFLVDGCPRCEEYLRELGLPFDAARFRAFWRKMVEVEFDAVGVYASRLDQLLGGQLYKIALAMQRGLGLDPHRMEEYGESDWRTEA